MSRDVLIRGDVVLFLDRAETDVTALPKDASLICEEDWANLIGPVAEGETFEQREAAYLESMGWKDENARY